MPFLTQQKYDPDLRPVSCDICGEVKPLRECHSVAIVYRMPGLHKDKQGNTTHGYAAYQCKDTQHFTCSHEHALLAAFMCTLEHIHEEGYKNNQHAGELELQHPTLLAVKEALDNYIQETLQERSKQEQESVSSSL